MPGIGLVAYDAGAVLAKTTPIDAMTKVRKVDIVTTSKILLLSQSAYVLRMKRHSEQTTCIMPKPEHILSNIRHLPGFPFGVKLRYRPVVSRIKGRCRVTI